MALLLSLNLVRAENGPRIIDIKVSPASLIEGNTKSPVTVQAVVTSLTGTVTGVSLDLASVGLPALELFDDGKHGDGEAGDKVYANIFTLTKSIPAADLPLPITAKTDTGGIATANVILHIAAAATGAITVWDGENPQKKGQGWIAPAKPINYLKVQTEEKHGGEAALELHGEGTGFIGGGWNWFGWFPPNGGTDITGYRNLTFWMKVESQLKPETLNVSLLSSTPQSKETLALDPTAYSEEALMDGQWHEIVIPLQDLIGAGSTFDPTKAWQFNINTWSPTARNFSVYLDDIGFDNRPARSQTEWVSLPEPRPAPHLPDNSPAVTADVDIKAAGTKISPYIYGAAMGDRKAAQEMGITVMRTGGNVASTVNWQKGFSARGSDWFFVNDGKEMPPEQNWLVTFHDLNKKAGLETYLTIPTMGRVAKDDTSVAFDIQKYPGQESWAGKLQPTDKHPNAGNGRVAVMGSDGKPTLDKKGNPVFRDLEADPNDTSVESSVEEQTGILKFMIDKMGYGTADQGGIKFVALDNEPDIWFVTHRGMHPKGASYDEYWQRTKDYASALKKIDPGVKIAGPVFSGWTAYFSSGLDMQAAISGKTTWDNLPDFAAHGNEPVLKWWMKKVHEDEKQSGQRLIDILDIHFYPQNGIYMGAKKNDPQVMEKRVQETRVMWDPTWKDPSWMSNDVNGKKLDGHLEIIHLMKRWIEECDPGLQLSFGEYSFGGEEDISGGVAEAELLGIFAREQVEQAYYWLFPPPNSSTYFGFKMFRNPDGKHTAFGDLYLPSKVSAPDDVSVHAARDSATGKITFVLVNKRAMTGAKVTLKLSSPVKSQDLIAYEYSGTDRHTIGQLPARKVEGNSIAVDLPALSVLRFNLTP